MAFTTLAQRFEEKSKQIYNTIISDTVYSEGGATSYTGRPVNSSQPFLIILPNTNGGALTSTSRVKDDTRALPVVSTARDVARLAQFVKSDAGKLFLAKQTFLQTQNAYTRTRLFNPVGLLASAVTANNNTRHVTQSFLNGVNTFRSRLAGLPTPTITNIVGDSPLEAGLQGNNGYLYPRLFSQGSKVSSRLLSFAVDKLKEEFSPLFPGTKKTPNVSDPFNDTPASSAKSDGTKIVYKFLQRQESPFAIIGNAGTTQKLDIITFKFGQVGSRGDEDVSVPFRAFISSIKENVKPEFTEQKYIGRTERFVTYSGAKRVVQLQFNIVALTKSELDHMWTRVNYLTGLAFPKKVSSTGFMVPPLFKITVGQLYNNQPCYIETLDYDFLDDQITFDIDREVSQVINVNMTLSILEKTSRYFDSPFYEITQRIVKNKQSIQLNSTRE